MIKGETKCKHRRRESESTAEKPENWGLFTGSVDFRFLKIATSGKTEKPRDATESGKQQRNGGCFVFHFIAPCLVFSGPPYLFGLLKYDRVRKKRKITPIGGGVFAGFFAILVFIGAPCVIQCNIL